MIGFAISAYDKFLDVAILTDIIRENWGDEYFISVCSNHPNASQRLEEHDVSFDRFTPGANIRYDPSMDGLRAMVNKHARVYDTITRSCRGAMDASNVTHVMHLHADAWPLAEEEVIQLVRDMQNANKPVAFKGSGPSYRHCPIRPVGGIMDQYFILESKFARDVGFFDHSATELFPEKHIHTMLMLVLLGKVGWADVYHYSNEREQVFWDGEFSPKARPMMYNPEYRFLHVATEDFPSDLGEALQAHYLHEHGLTEGTTIPGYLAEYHCPSESLFDELAQAERCLDKRLRVLGSSMAQLNRNFREAKNILSMNRRSKVRFALRKRAGWAYRLGGQFRNRVESMFRELLGSPIQTDAMTDAWPDQDFTEVYADNLDSDDFPQEKTDELWFAQTDN